MGLSTELDSASDGVSKHQCYDTIHGLRTPNECINQRILKFWADVANKLASAVSINLGLGFDFRPCCEGNFLTGRP